MTSSLLRRAGMAAFLLSLTLTAPMAAGAADSPTEAKPVLGPEGDFAYCLIGLPQPQGRRVTLARSVRDETNLELKIPGGKFKVRDQYDLEVALPPAPARPMRAIAMDADSLLIQIGANQDMYKAIGAAKSLTASAGGNTLSFDLSGAAKAVSSLNNCVAYNRPKDAKTAKTQPAKKSEAFPETLRGILADAGVDPLQPLDLSGIPEESRPADYAWQSGPLLGGLREKMVPDAKSLEELVGLHIDGLKSKCSGAFTSTINRAQKAPDLTLLTAEAQCRMTVGKETRDIAAETLFYLTKSGRFVSLTHETEGSKKALAQAIRDKLAENFLTAARKAGESETKKTAKEQKSGKK